MKKLAFALILLVAPSLFAGNFYFSSASRTFSKNEFCYYNISVPKIAVAARATKQQKKVAKYLNTQWVKGMNDEIAAWEKAIAEEGMCESYQFANTIDSSFEIKTPLNAPIVSIQFISSYYSGGAHGYTGLSAQTFNQSTGEVYTSLAPFVSPSNATALKDLLLARLKADYEYFDPEFGYNDWATKTRSTSQIDNFYFNAQGVVVVFNAYEIGSYAEGPYEVQVYWYELAPLLKTSGPATLLPAPSALQ